MREIKFRAWCKYNNLMWNVEGLSYNGPNSSLSHVLLARPHVSQVFPVSDAELMQYTGLKDKHGVEICEGDIVRWYGPSAVRRNDVYVRSVHWQKDEAMFLPNNMSGEVEVIGNIYEHPELVKS